jgi:hypothetical protein
MPRISVLHHERSVAGDVGVGKFSGKYFGLALPTPVPKKLPGSAMWNWTGEGDLPSAALAPPGM